MGYFFFFFSFFLYFFLSFLLFKVTSTIQFLTIIVAQPILQRGAQLASSHILNIFLWQQQNIYRTQITGRAGTSFL
jgi:hypothetical protein